MFIINLKIMMVKDGQYIKKGEKNEKQIKNNFDNYYNKFMFSCI